MFGELGHVRQVARDEFRRIFRDGTLELMVWYKPDKSIYGFQLCYGKMGREKALRWLDDRDFHHYRVDTGEESAVANRSPILVEDGQFELEQVLPDFQASSAGLPLDVKAFVSEKLQQYAVR